MKGLCHAFYDGTILVMLLVELFSSKLELPPLSIRYDPLGVK